MAGCGYRHDHPLRFDHSPNFEHAFARFAKCQTCFDSEQSEEAEMTRRSSGSVNEGRHAAECKICAHPQREQIDRDFVNWRSPVSITKQYGLRNRTSVYRHAHAVGLFAKRQRNVRAALEKIIERAGEVDVTAAAVVAAVQAYTKINAAGQWIDRSEHVNLNDLFERMTTEEMEDYARDGTLPAWFKAAVGATIDYGPGV